MRASATTVDDYFAQDKRPVILFDGVCNLCNVAVNVVLQTERTAADSPGAVRFAALQSAAGRALLQRAGRAPDDISSIVLVEPTGQAPGRRRCSRSAAPTPLPELAGLLRRGTHQVRRSASHRCLPALPAAAAGRAVPRAPAAAARLGLRLGCCQPILHFWKEQHLSA